VLNAALPAEAMPALQPYREANEKKKLKGKKRA
jgi:hypothetical protein